MSMKYRRRPSDNPACRKRITLTSIEPIVATDNAIRNSVCRVTIDGTVVEALVTMTGREAIVMFNVQVKFNE